MADVARCKERSRLNNHNYVPMSWPVDSEGAGMAPAERGKGDIEGWQTAPLSDQDRKLVSVILCHTSTRSHLQEVT